MLRNVCLFVQINMQHLASWMDRNEGNEKKKAYIYYTEISPSNYAALHPTHSLSYFPDSTEACVAELFYKVFHVMHISEVSQCNTAVNGAIR